MLWVIFTITATIFQTFRNLEQKSLNQKLDTLTVSWSRFILPLPAALITLIYNASDATRPFLLYCTATAIFQILGNSLLLKTIKSRNFSIGIAFYKTEVLQSMILGLLVFGTEISLGGFIAIIITSIGMVMMSNISFSKNISFFKQFDNSATFGAASGFCFAISAFNLKAGTQEMINIGHNYLSSAVIVLMWVITIQNIIFLLVKSWQKRLKQDLGKLFKAENKWSFAKTGLLSFCGSVFWFAAYALGDNVVYVKAVGQIELLFAVLVSHLHLKEKQKRSEIFGIIFTAIGILSLILVH